MLKKRLGVLGGLGPMSTFYFCELLTAHTSATCDADHIDMIVSSRASTPDRTAYILGHSDRSPLPVMQEEATRLTAAGADLIVIPCNTAHYFYDALTACCNVPMLNIIQETVRFLHLGGVQRFGLLATEGTVRSHSYQKYASGTGMECLLPNEAQQTALMQLIYNEVKSGRAPALNTFQDTVRALAARGCEAIVLGCTELSLLRRYGVCDPLLVDSLEVLAYRTITECGKQPIGFPKIFERLGAPYDL